MKLLALAMAQAHLAQCRHSLCNPIVKSNNNVQTRPQQHRCFYLAVICKLANTAPNYAAILPYQQIYSAYFGMRCHAGGVRKTENRRQFLTAALQKSCKEFARRLRDSKDQV